MSDEMVVSTTPPTEQEVDQRFVAYEANGIITGLYTQLHKARLAANDAIVALQTYSDDGVDDSRVPEMWAISAFTYIYFGENYCDGVTYSTLDGSSVVYDTSRTSIESFSLASERFDSALASATIEPDIEYLARIGKARAYLDLSLDSAPAAAALVSGIPTDFRYVTEHSGSPLLSQNAIATYSSGGLLSVSHEEGGNGLPYHDQRIRVPVDSTLDDDGNVTTGLDGSTPQFYLRKYPSSASPIALADGMEARLIEAEADLVAGSFGPMNTRLNDLRDLIGLAPLAVPGDADAARDQLFSERAYWLFATGHRHSDMRRLVRQYDLDPNDVFPIGPYLKGGSYGDQVSLPLPFEASVNPRFNRDMCDPTRP